MLNMLYVGLFVGILVVVLAMALRKPVLFKMGARNFVRHKSHSALVVAGLLVGTAIISGAMVTGESIDNFIVKSTYDSLNLVDVTVTAPGHVYYNESAFWSINNSTAVQAETDGIAPMISTIVSAEDSRSGQFEASMTLMAFDPTLEKPFGNFTLTDGTQTYATDLTITDAIINEKAATALDATVGDPLMLRYMPQGATRGQQSEFNVKYVVQNDGKGQYQGGSGIFIRLDSAQSMLNVTGMVNQVRISGKGDMRAGVDHTDAILTAVNATIATSADPLVRSLKVNPEKRDSLATSKQTGEMVTMFITIFGSFSIIAGVILIINIFTMLAEERKSELGMARAVGMTRRDLMQMFLFEGSTYTIAAAAMGTLAGLSIGFGLIWGVNNIFNIFADLKIPFYFTIDSLVNAFCMGGAITFLTILAASWRVTNINIVRAIRDIEDPVQKHASKISVALGGVLFALMLVTFFLGYNNLNVRYVAPCMALIGLALMMRGFLSARLSFSIAGIGLIAWTLWAISDFFQKGETGSEYLFITSGVFLVLAAVIIVMFNSDAVVAIVSGTLGKLRSMRPVVKTAISHPLNKRFRTGMTVAMFTLVIYTIVMVSVFTSVFSFNVDDTVAQQGGGYQIIGTTQMPVASLSNASITGANNVTIPVKSQTLIDNVSKYEQISMVIPTPAMLFNGTAEQGGAFGFGRGTSILAIDDGFIANNSFGFSAMDPHYTTPQAVWTAVHDDPHKVVWGAGAGGGFGGGASVGVGTVIAINTVVGNATGNTNFTVIGVLNSNVMSGVIMTKAHAYVYFAGLPRTFVWNLMFLFQVRPDHDVQATTFGLEKDFHLLGMNTINLKEMVKTLLGLINSIFMLFQVFLGLGLVVGIAGLGIITIRSVVERKREIGIMRAIGFARSKILASFVTEILFICTLAVAIGVVVGIVVSYEIFTIMVSGLNVAYSIPWLNIGIILAITYVAALACTIVPAVRASRMPPAEALRTNE